MKRLLFAMIAALFVSMVYGQSDTVFIKYSKDANRDTPDYKVDTLVSEGVFNKQILYGTRVLPGTANQEIVKGYGISLDKVSVLECQDEDRIPEQNKILSIKENQDSLLIEIELLGNCCHSFLCDVQIIDDKTINLLTHGYGNYCFCLCPFSITFYFSKMGFKDYEKLKDIIINGNIETRKKLR